MTHITHPYIAETGAEMLKLVRAPEFILPTLVLPVVFYTLFGVILPAGEGSAAYLLATFGVFAVMGPALFGFGAGVAQERERGWLKLTRAAPAPAAGFMVAKTLATISMAALALTGVYAVAAFIGGVELTARAWILMLGVHILAAIPFLLAGLAVGFTLATNGAVAMANLLFLAFAVLGGLWIPITVFPEVMQNMAFWLPSFHLAELSLAASGAPGDRPVVLHLAMVVGMIAVFALLAGLAWARQR
jgi:ABC-2 type transport system permease protein